MILNNTLVGFISYLDENGNQKSKRLVTSTNPLLGAELGTFGIFKFFQ